MRRNRKQAVQLTSLLDLLFVMIFISLLQTKTPAVQAVVEAPKPTEATVAPPPVLEVTAIFHFFPTASNSQAATGTYAMGGRYDTETGDIQFGGISWIQRPTGYDMVPLVGKLSADELSFTGRVDFPQCEVFTLKRTSRKGVTAISGKWEGSYVCSQGETGLLLTVQ